MSQIGDFSQNATATLGRVDGILQGVPPGSIGTSVRNIEEATATARKVANDVAAVTDKFETRAMTSSRSSPTLRR